MVLILIFQTTNSKKETKVKGKVTGEGKREDKDEEKMITKVEARKRLGLQQYKLALAQGFFTATKGWDIISKVKMPKGCKIVINYSNFYNNEEKLDIGLGNSSNNNVSDTKSIQIINLNKKYLTEEEISLLFLSCDVVFLPYKVSSGSGVMYDGIGHGRPFVASNVGFSRIFIYGLGHNSKKESKGF